MTGRRSALACLLFICGLLGVLLWYSSYDYRELTFSRESGFYAEPFELEMFAPLGARIYYTLDGSVPDENAFLYTDPLVIDDATSHPNVYAMRSDTATDFLRDGSGYKLPDYLIDKCTIIRAAYQNVDGNFSEVKTESYFVGYDMKESYQNMSVMSVVTESENLFDPDKGIYVLGRQYNEGLEDLEELEENANYVQHGFDWERPADIQLFGTDRGVILKQSCGIRIQGGASRNYIPKSMNFYARENYDNARRFYADIFGTGYLADTITLTAGGQDDIAKFRDMFVSTLSKDKDFCTMHYSPCVMFLNGEYWGVYWLTERYTDVYLEYYYGVDDDNIVIIKKNKVADGTEEDWALYNSMMNYLNNTDFSDPVNYENLGYIIDLQSYIDYYATEIYIGSCTDWPGNNEAFWRARQASKEGGYEDGRWRWMLFDVNTHSLSSDLIEKDTIKYVEDHSAAFTNLCQSETFKQQFTITLMDLANITFSKENTEPAIAEYINLMYEPLNMHIDRFYGKGAAPYRLDKEIADIRNFLEHRGAYIAQYAKEHFGLTGTLATVAIETTDSDAGNVILNTSDIPFGNDKKWNGEYFTDYPVMVTAAAEDGYHFAGWEIDRGQGFERVDGTQLELDVPENGLSVKAVFEED